MKSVLDFEVTSREVKPPVTALPPPWVVASVSRWGGHRTPKLELPRPAAVYGWNPYSADGYGANEDFRERALNRRERRQAKRAARNVVPKGNLGESDYQFWRGFSSGTYMNAICRWCTRNFYNLHDRQEHFRKEGKCSFLIRATQEFASKRSGSLCLSCGETTLHRRWGFPLCNTERCLCSWKFGVLDVQRGWQLYRNLARTEGALAGYL